MAKLKLDEIKKKIGYVKQSPRCGNCEYFDEVRDIKRLKHYPFTTFVIHRKCSKFGFATKPNAYCKEWELEEMVEEKKDNLG